MLSLNRQVQVLSILCVSLAILTFATDLFAFDATNTSGQMQNAQVTQL
jgi:hypothetical protein